MFHQHMDAENASLWITASGRITENEIPLLSGRAGAHGNKNHILRLLLNRCTWDKLLKKYMEVMCKPFCHLCLFHCKASLESWHTSQDSEYLIL